MLTDEERLRPFRTLHSAVEILLHLESLSVFDTSKVDDL
jgi:hypothetical protein